MYTYISNIVTYGIGRLVHLFLLRNVHLVADASAAGGSYRFDRLIDTCKIDKFPISQRFFRPAVLGEIFVESSNAMLIVIIKSNNPRQFGVIKCLRKAARTRAFDVPTQRGLIGVWLAGIVCIRAV